VETASQGSIQDCVTRFGLMSQKKLPTALDRVIQNIEMEQRTFAKEPKMACAPEQPEEQ